MQRFKTILILSTLFLMLNAQNKAIESKVENLLSKMTLEDKVGQMTQLDVKTFLEGKKNDNPDLPYSINIKKLDEVVVKYKVGSILNVGGSASLNVDEWRDRITQIQAATQKTRLKIPVLYGIDAIHGNNYTTNSVLFPQPITQAASFNRDLVKKIAETTAYETRSSFIPWTFSPAMDLTKNPSWARLWESYGEDPLLNSELGSSCVLGYQGNYTTIDKYHVTACLKHFICYGASDNGHDRTQANVSERELREYYLPPYQAAIKAGALTVMVNSGEINGTPVHINKYLLTNVLKKELGFTGFVVSDWEDIKELYNRHKVAKDNKEAVEMAINAGVDMSMVPFKFDFYTDLIELVNEGKVSMSRIDDAVRRILRVKFIVGLFENPIGNKNDYPNFNSLVSNKQNYDAVGECVTLLKNENNLLPLSRNMKVLVTGPCANSMRVLNGGWSRTWQGESSDKTEENKNTILEAIQNVFGAEKTEYEEGASFDELKDVNKAIDKARNCDVIILCIGEISRTEAKNNINNLEMSESQIELAKALSKTGKPIVYVLSEGRPRIISRIEAYAKAIVDIFIPGNEGGNVLADILIGKINPSGKLPFTYPRYPNELNNYYCKYVDIYKDNNNFDNPTYYPQWEFGYGLSYTTFEYSNLKLSSMNLMPTKPIIVSVDVKNTGNMVGKEIVILYTADIIASITPEVKRMRDFTKIELAPGESKTVEFTIDKEKLSFINAQLKRVTEPGEFKVMISNLSETFNYQ